jgi:flavin reductase (DIM6/NTAB) family NADH-FMN oxidoreductase RutF
MGCFPTGVTIVTSWDHGEAVGSTVSAFCSVSLEPPLLLICLDLRNPIRWPVERERIFGVNFLDEEGQSAARRFAQEPREGVFSDFPYRSAPGGAPQLERAPVFIDCSVHDIHLAGDHIIAVGRGERIEIAAHATPLLYHRGRYQRMPATE